MPISLFGTTTSPKHNLVEAFSQMKSIELRQIRWCRRAGSQTKPTMKGSCAARSSTHWLSPARRWPPRPPCPSPAEAPAQHDYPPAAHGDKATYLRKAATAPLAVAWDRKNACACRSKRRRHEGRRPVERSTTRHCRSSDSLRCHVQKSSPIINASHIFQNLSSLINTLL